MDGCKSFAAARCLPPPSVTRGQAALAELLVSSTAKAVVGTACVPPKALDSAVAVAVRSGMALTHDGGPASRGPLGDEVEARIAQVRPVLRERVLAAASGSSPDLTGDQVALQKVATHVFRGPIRELGTSGAIAKAEQRGGRGRSAADRRCTATLVDHCAAAQGRG